MFALKFVRASAVLVPALALSVFLQSAHAAEVKAGAITVLDAWARATPAQAGGAFLTIRNDGDAADTLTDVASPAAHMAHLHTTKKENGVMEMRPVEGVQIPPHATVTLQPGGLHVMLMGLAKPLKEGDSFPLALTFAKAGQITATVTVKAAGAMGDMGDMK